MSRETTVSRLIKPEDLNHHGTLFAGRMAEWLVETSFIAATRLVGKPEDVVCTRIRDMTFKQPLRSGQIIELCARVVRLGRRSITVQGEVRVAAKARPAVTMTTTFVTVDRDGRPYAHGLTLLPRGG
jgi:acyl-CoA hydrolase